MQCLPKLIRSLCECLNNMSVFFNVKLHVSLAAIMSYFCGVCTDWLHLHIRYAHSFLELCFSVLDIIKHGQIHEHYYDRRSLV